MKILFVTYCRAMLGANRSLIQLMKDLRDRYGVEPYVLMWDVEDGSLDKELDKMELPYLIHPMKAWVVAEDAKYKRLRGIKTYINNKKYVNQIIKKLEEEKFDLIYSNNSTIQTGADIAKKLNLPHIWHVREYGKRDYNIEFSYPKKKIKDKFDDAAAVIAISKNLDQYIKENISDSANIICIYNGIYSNKSVRTIWNANKKLQFCHVGALQEGKNQMELLKSAALLVQRDVTDFHVTFIGEGNDYERLLKEYCKEKHLEPYITFAGYCDNVPEMLDSMDVGIICSKSEAFGRVTVEYMFSSMPVIGAIGFGTSELIIHGENGYLYPGGDCGKLAEYMQEIMNHRELLQRMGSQAYFHATANFTSEQNTDRIYQLILSVLNR